MHLPRSTLLLLFLPLAIAASPDVVPKPPTCSNRYFYCQCHSSSTRLADDKATKTACKAVSDERTSETGYGVEFLEEEEAEKCYDDIGYLENCEFDDQCEREYVPVVLEEGDIQKRFLSFQKVELQADIWML
ncbi:hypothetical protein EJ03DRAFT_354247 [Teratosphaeria nubilosa]|uniref:Extracellular membrane protein CFEM domain-containing protein n=1 Tax=Teratosphaeria nubilosa TaxID=161662 RepID=A0A6G1KZW7_9PEZI|nr:hypothetical protein EJ03DRAFT_354247 [Teratosphaeria nubilosa]